MLSASRKVIHSSVGFPHWHSLWVSWCVYLSFSSWPLLHSDHHVPSGEFSFVLLWVFTCPEPGSSPLEFLAGSFLCRPYFCCGFPKAFTYLLQRRFTLFPYACLACLRFTSILFPVLFALCCFVRSSIHSPMRVPSVSPTFPLYSACVALFTHCANRN